MLGLAAWLLYLDPRGRQNVSFAAFLTARGLTLFFSLLEPLDPERARLWIPLLGMFHLVTIGALVFFAANFPYPRGIVGGSRYAVGWVALAILAYSVLILRDPCLVICYAGDGAPLVGIVLVPTTSVLLGAAALVILSERRRLGETPLREQVLLVGGILAANALFDATRDLTLQARGSYAVDFGAALPGGLVAWSPIVAFALASTAIATTLGTRRPRRLLLVCGLALASGLVVGGAGAEGVAALNLVITGFWRLAVPAVVAYGLIHLQLFELDARVRVGISRSTLFGFFGVAFLVADEFVTNLVGDQYGLAAGALAAGGLLVAVAPLRRLAHRFAKATVPEKTLGPETYLAAAEVALADGILTPAEERGLAKLAQRIGLDPVQALDLRDEAARRLKEALSPATETTGSSPL